MKPAKFLFLLVALGIGGSSAVSAGGETDRSISVTIYNNDLASVRDVRTLSFVKGVDTLVLGDVPARLDPTSVHFRALKSPEKVGVMEQNFEYDLVSKERLLEKYLGLTVTVRPEKEKELSGKLLSTSGGDLILRKSDGAVTILPVQSVKRVDVPSLPTALHLKPALVWLIQSAAKGKQPCEISYLTSGMSWQAQYVAVMNEGDTALDLDAWVSITNKCGATFHDAELKLVAGEVHKAPPKRRLPVARRYALTAEAAKTGFEEKPFFEYHLYTLDRPTTIKDRQIKQVRLFPGTHVSCGKTYVYDGAADKRRVRVEVVFRNTKKAGLGQPLPAGLVRVFKRDEDGAVEFVGEDRIEHTPADEELRLFLGYAFDLVGEREQLETKRLGKEAREEKWQIKLRNHKKQAVKIRVVEHLWGDWEIREASHPYEKKSARELRFHVEVPASGEVVITYAVLFRY